MTASPQSTRRTFLQGTAAATAMTLVTDPLNAKKKNEGNWIDAHSHIWTRDLKTFPLAKGQKLKDLDPPSFNAKELFAVARPEGVRKVVLIQHSIYHGFDNTYLVDAARRYPKEFRVVGMVDDHQNHPDVDMKKLHKQRVSGFRITPFVRKEEQQKTWLETPGMSVMWKHAAKSRQAMCCLIDAKDLPQVYQTCKKFPDTKCVIDHFARIGVDGKMRDSQLKDLCKLAEFKHTYVKISAYYALGKKKAPYLDLIPMIKRLIDAFGVERCMWASDSPYQVVKGHTYAASIALIRDRMKGLSKGDREWLLRKTAEKVYYY